MNESEKQARKLKDIDLSTLDDSTGEKIESAFMESLATIRENLESMQRPWQEIAQSINDLGSPLVGISESLKQLSGSSEGFKDVLSEGTRNTEQISKTLSDARQHAQAFDRFSELGNHVRQTTSAFEAWKPLFTRLTEPSDARDSGLGQRLVINSKLLAERGWFPDPNMPLGLLSRLATTVGEDPIEVDTVFGNHLKGQLTKVEEDLIKLSAERAHLIQDAFWAHRQGKYSLSIPVFLSQADGLWFDRFNVSVFMSRDREGTNVADPTHFGSIRIQLLEALRIASLPIWILESKRERSFSDLNRHQVLHGEVVDYDTEEYSLKAISFLRWLCWTFSNVDVSKSAGN